MSVLNGEESGIDKTKAQVLTKGLLRPPRNIALGQTNSRLRFW